MVHTVRVELGERSYDIRIGRGAAAGAALAAAGPWKAWLVSDTNVAPLYAGAVEAALRARGATVALRSVVPAGEASKDLAVVTRLCQEGAAAGLDRRAVVVALGGGVVGDLAGFVAAIYLRGLRFIQAPTSLLAMVDSSVGGKTGVNLPQGKNLVGAFHQPCEVTIDLDALTTLPSREYCAGLAEVVKYGMMWDAAFFDALERDAVRLMDRELDLLAEVVARCCAIKAAVVGADERESGPRALLNFGHTLGHAIENVYHYGHYLHGEAVALGMVYAADVGVRAHGLPAAERDRLVALLARLGLPVRLAALADGTAPAALWPALTRAMTSDKKTVGGVPRFVLAERIGHAATGCVVEEAVLRDVFLTGVARAQAAGEGGQDVRGQ